MADIKHGIEQFFNAYAERVKLALAGAVYDVEATVRSFASCFIEASPAGVICGNNDESFRKKIPAGYDFYRKIGIEAMYILSKEITLLNECYAMAKINWAADFTKQQQEKGSIEFQVIYLLRINEGSLKIFAYITGDEEAALKEHGLIKEAQEEQ